ncbi:hypothetical protein MP228_003449 [Amoeboaphelidium protococcarum]|nr:hypothetical protein MP228_003449 [Amoeboaphelidium protococcarum]
MQKRQLHRFTSEQEEDASVNNLGPEFNGERCLFYSEVKVVLDRLKAQANKDLPPSFPQRMNEQFESTLAYVSKMSKFNRTDSVKEVRRVLSEAQMQHSLSDYEVAQICNLMPQLAEEAYALIPSLLSKIEEYELSTLLNEILNIKRFE